ncbi:MAG: hypothetical protein MUC81_05800 [Bacteroidia bacterium]|jgi:uncharacterized protein with von Willebrand factor type A (vWA) domain|nr:hypothetical protein [Bacteroidia bacterium]
MLNYAFHQYIPPKKQAGFDELLKLFLQLMQYTNGSVSETLEWMNELDKEYRLTDNTYGMGDFIDDLKKNGYISDEDDINQSKPTPKTNKSIRTQALEEVFGKIKKTKSGNHQTYKPGMGDEQTASNRSFQFGDRLDQIDFTASIQQAQINHGINSFTLTENDLQVKEQDHKSQTSTVLLIDISHSMILYGEDRITPAKKVAMALAELIKTKYPKDTLDILVFGNDAWPIEIKDLPYLQVGPYHTNTYAGMELAMDLLRRRKNPNKQMFMITDGKPTCLKEGNRYYKNSFGLDRKIINKTLNQAAQCRRLGIKITTFMIASDPYLMQFVQEFTSINNGKAFYSSLNNLGQFVFEDYENNRRKTFKK